MRAPNVRHRPTGHGHGPLPVDEWESSGPLEATTISPPLVRKKVRRTPNCRPGSSLEVLLNSNEEALHQLPAAWDVPVESTDLAALIEHARLFSLVVQGAGLSYNLALANRYEAMGLSQVEQPVARYRENAVLLLGRFSRSLLARSAKIATGAFLGLMGAGLVAVAVGWSTGRGQVLAFAGGLVLRAVSAGHLHLTEPPWRSTAERLVTGGAVMSALCGGRCTRGPHGHAAAGGPHRVGHRDDVVHRAHLIRRAPCRG